MDLEDGEIEDLANQASNLASFEQSSFRRLRGGGNSGFNDYSRTAPIRANDLAVLKTRFPYLTDFSDEFLMSRSTDELLRIESTSMKLRDAEKGRDVEDRLHANKAALASRVTAVEAGSDNRWTELHAARFLGGAACSTQKLWLQARIHIGLTGHPPLSNYDMTSCGLGGFITNRGWLELGNPASTRISLKYFNINNCGSKAGAARLLAANSDDLAEIQDLGEFKLALRSLRTAAQFVCPWNFSFLALEGFLIQSDFCRAELLHEEKPAHTLCQFVDFILATNADRWRDSEGFLTTGELASYWASFYGARPKARSSHSGGGPGPMGGGGGVSHSGYTRLPAEKKKRVRFPWVDICHMWNLGKCAKPAGTCVSSKGVPLRHCCDWRDLNNPAAVCGRDHQRTQFH